MTYNLKIINPKKKSQYKVEKFRKSGKFETPMELKSYIRSEFKEAVSGTADFDIGYTISLPVVHQQYELKELRMYSVCTVCSL